MTTSIRNITAIDASNIWSDADLRRQSQQCLAAAQQHAGLPWLERRGFGRHRECGVGGRGACLCRLWHRVFRRGHAHHLWRLAGSAIGIGQLPDSRADRLRHRQLSRAQGRHRITMRSTRPPSTPWAMRCPAPPALSLFTASNTGGNSGTVEEKDYGLYLEIEGKVPIYDHNLRYNVGLRLVETHQYITSPLANINPANSTVGWMAANIPPSTASRRQAGIRRLPAVGQCGL